MTICVSRPQADSFTGHAKTWLSSNSLTNNSWEGGLEIFGCHTGGGGLPIFGGILPHFPQDHPHLYLMNAPLEDDLDSLLRWCHHLGVWSVCWWQRCLQTEIQVWQWCGESLLRHTSVVSLKNCFPLSVISKKQDLPLFHPKQHIGSNSKDQAVMWITLKFS